KNISVGGLFLVTAHRCTVGEVVPLVITFEAWRLQAHARVTHSQADGVGFSFANITPEFQNEIEDLVDDLLSSGAGVADRRRWTRVLARGALIFEGGDRRDQGELRDISRRGAYVVTDKPLVVEDHVYVYLAEYLSRIEPDFPSGLRGCRARVAHRYDDGFGIEFVAPSAEFAMAVDALIRRTSDLEEEE
ncbi:PilZ domain-containing protein, partial [Myxococcota bacterium]